jgi:hypothetical protein
MGPGEPDQPPGAGQGVAAGLQPGQPGVALQQLAWVPGNGPELQATLLDCGLEGLVGGNPHLVAGPAQPASQGQVGLDVPARSNGQDGDMHYWRLPAPTQRRVMAVAQGRRACGSGPSTGLSTASQAHSCPERTPLVASSSTASPVAAMNPETAMCRWLM